MYQIRAFAIFQTAKVVAIVYGIVAAVVSAFWFIGLMINGRPLMAVAALLFGPLVYGAVSFVATAVLLWIYNLIVPTVGAIEIELRHPPAV
jgi:hypothetical protein